MGVAHQGGVVKSIVALRSSTVSQNPQAGPLRVVDVYYSHTYMPPYSLSVQKNSDVLPFKDGSVMVHDSKGVVESVFDSCEKHRIQRWSAGVRDHDCFLAVPTSIKLSPLQRERLTLVDEYFPHVSFEDIPRVDSISQAVQQLSLRLYRVSGRLPSDEEMAEKTERERPPEM